MLEAIKRRMSRDDEKTPSFRATVPVFRFAEYYVRIVFIITSTALLGLTGFIAANLGSEHIEKIYAAAITGAIVAILADFIIFIIQCLKPKAAPAIALVDTISIILCAISIPTIINSDLQNDQDTAAWRLAVVVIIERMTSILICLSSCFRNQRKSKEHLKPQIFDQKTIHSATNSQFSPSTAAPSTYTAPSVMTAPSIMAPTPARTPSV
ncbi:hypothetical protein V8F06_013807 [Rhypophila decipiens]